MRNEVGEIGVTQKGEEQEEEGSVEKEGEE